MSNVAELTAAVTAALEDPALAGQRTFPLQVGERTYWVKQAIGNDPAGVRLWHKLGFSGPFDLKPRPLSSRERLHFEGDRLKALAKAGQPVPEVTATGDTWLLLESVGDSLRLLLPQWDKDRQVQVLTGQAAALGAFHAAGFWHGGSQLKNLGVQGDQVCRFDFEESFSEDADLTVIQARDLYLYLHSCADWLPIFAGGGAELLQAYTAANGNPEVLSAARDAIRRTGFWRALVRPFMGIMGRDVKRVVRTADLLLA